MGYLAPFLIAALFAVAGLLLSRRARPRGAGAEAMVEAALTRIAEGERGVRVEAETWGKQARIASGINAVIQAHEAGAPGDVEMSGDHALLRRLRAALDRSGQDDVRKPVHPFQPLRNSAQSSASSACARRANSPMTCG